MLSRKLKRMVEEGLSSMSALESNLLSAAQGTAVKKIFVTSARRREGKTTSAVVIAHALSATSDGRVALVDCNLSNPTLHECFQISDTPGLTDYLTSRSEVSAVAVDTEFPRLAVVPLGAAIASVGGAFAPQAFKGKLDALASQFEHVVFDGDSVLNSSNATLIAKYFDGVLLVVECEKTKWEVLNLAREKVDSVGGNVLGVVMNKRRHYIPRRLYGKV